LIASAHVRSSIFGDDDDDELFTSLVTKSRFSTTTTTTPHTGGATPHTSGATPHTSGAGLLTRHKSPAPDDDVCKLSVGFRVSFILVHVLQQ